MQAAAQRQPQRETLRLFREPRTWNRIASLSYPERAKVVITETAVATKTMPELLPKEQMCCNMATD